MMKPDYETAHKHIISARKPRFTPCFIRLFNGHSEIIRCPSCSVPCLYTPRLTETWGELITRSGNPAHNNRMIWASRYLTGRINVQGERRGQPLEWDDFAVIVDCESSRCREGSDGYARRLRFLFDCDDKSQVEVHPFEFETS